MDEDVSLAGQLLLALPGIGDPRFERAVIAMCSHDEGGALGIGIGRIFDGLGFHALLGQMEIEPGVAPDVPVHIGGPVELQRGFLLHSQDWTSPDTLRVGARWGLTATLDILRAIAAGEGPAHWLVALGYAGWAAGQLDGEMQRHGWLTAPGNDALVFRSPAAMRWEGALTLAGIDPRLLAGETGTA